MNSHGFSAILVLMLLAQIFPAQAMTESEIRGAVQGLISQRHPDHVEDFWASLGPDALPVLKKMYRESQSVTEKSWIMDGLSHYDDPSVGELLENDITRSQDEVMRKKMLASLIRSQGEAAYDFAQKYLDDEDPHVRQAVAQGLKQYGGNSPRVRKRLDDYMKGEKESWVKVAVDKTQAVSHTLKQERNPYQLDSASPVPSPTPLPEASWTGEWKGAWITPTKNSAANVQLTLVNAKATADQQKWRIELKLPKESKRELKEKDLSITVFQSARGHWLEIRDKKNDAVFIASRFSSGASTAPAVK
ncbi:MAG: HEAT repeat domain-containing protein [Bdellovibrionales bacterium]|nr:HEAT repeat domain-containing protein [Bdellovibrionales bacterium]